MHTTGPAAPAPAQIVIASPRNGLGISSFILGLVATVIGMIPILGIPALACALTGLGLGLGNIGRLRRKTSTSKWATILGIILSVLGTILAIAGIITVTAAANKLQSDLSQLPAAN